MNNVVSLSENVRTNCAERLLRNISLKGMHYRLAKLFVDRTKIDTSIFGRFNDENPIKTMYADCLQFNCGFKSKLEHDMFIPFDDGDKE